MLVDQFDAFLLDLDGVVYVGDAVLPGVTEALAGLRSRGRVARFVTNDPRPTRKDVVHRLGRLGVRATVEEIVSSGWATACWLRQQKINSAYVVGSDGLCGELAAQNVESVEGCGAEAVLAGCDETITYRDLARATALLRTGVPFVATNVDATFPTATGPRPATGAVVAAIQTASGADRSWSVSRDRRCSPGPARAPCCGQGGGRGGHSGHGRRRGAPGGPAGDPCRSRGTERRPCAR